VGGVAVHCPSLPIPPSTTPTVLLSLHVSPQSSHNKTPAKKKYYNVCAQSTNQLACSQSAPFLSRPRSFCLLSISCSCAPPLGFCHPAHSNLCVPIRGVVLLLHYIHTNCTPLHLRPPIYTNPFQNTHRHPPPAHSHIISVFLWSCLHAFTSLNTSAPLRPFPFSFSCSFSFSFFLFLFLSQIMCCCGGPSVSTKRASRWEEEEEEASVPSSLGAAGTRTVMAISAALWVWVLCVVLIGQTPPPSGFNDRCFRSTLRHPPPRTHNKVYARGEQGGGEGLGVRLLGAAGWGRQGEGEDGRVKEAEAQGPALCVLWPVGGDWGKGGKGGMRIDRIALVIPSPLGRRSPFLP
jgi:hypothetical protein